MALLTCLFSIRYLGLKIDNNNINTDNLFNLNNIQSDNGIRRYCQSYRVLNSPVQRQLCLKNEKIVGIFARGAKLAIEECQHQFRFKRWNCSIFNRYNVFGRLALTSKKIK